MLQEAIRTLGIVEIDEKSCSKLIGVGTDGASANVAGNGLKGMMEKKLPWLFWMWCMAHRLELAVKDALKGTAFDEIDEMLLRLYYIYENSPKKCRQLVEVVNDLRECFVCEEGGTKPIRASGSRWIGHKWNAMNHVLAKYGAYTNHLAALSEDQSIKSTDRSKIKGYHDKWIDGKYILGCALFVDLLNPCVILSKVMQNDDLDIVQALSSLIKSMKEIDKLSSTPLDQWAVYSATLEKCSTTEANGKVIYQYQCQDLKQFTSAKMYYAIRYTAYCSVVTDCIRNRMRWSDLQLL